MLVMGIDTALQRCSVAILRDGEVIADCAADMERGHAEYIAPMVAEALNDAAINVSDLDRVGVVVGPGGFTGVRIALSFARGMAIGMQLEVVGVTSLAALAHSKKSMCNTGFIAPVIDARRGEVYAGLYRADGRTVIAPFVASPDETIRQIAKAEIEGIDVIGSGAGLLTPCPEAWRVLDSDTQISGVSVALIASTLAPTSAPPTPLYLRAPDAKRSSSPRSMRKQAND